MAPKKEKAQKLSLGEFLGETGGVSSWADEVEDSYASGTQSFPSTDRRTGPSSYGNTSYGNDRGYHSLRDNLPQELPTKPPYTAHLGNLSYDATVESVTDFFHDCNVVNVRIIEDREQNRPKGFAYAEFADLEGLKTALTRDGQSFEGRNIRIKVADPPRGGFGDRAGGESFRELDWGAKRGPLADVPGRSNNRDFGERRPPREFNDERPVREAREMTWERRGPLPPAERPESREGARARTTTDFGTARKASPAAWGPGEGRQGGDGSRPPRREFAERPERPERPERAPTAAEKEINWRNNMRPVEPKSREGSEAPGSPAGAPAALPSGRPKLNLTKRTVSEAPDVLSPAPTSKSNPFGAARPIDTAAREREVEEKRIKDKLEAEEKAKAEKEAKEAAAAEAAEKAKAEEAAAVEAAAKAKAEAEAAAAAGAKPEAQEDEGEQKLPVKTREPAPKSRAAESGSWRRATGDAPSRGAPSGPRRGGGAPRGPRQDGGRPPRSNGTDVRGPLSPTTEKAPASPAVDDDGWTTVTQPVKGRRGGNRPLA
ncbi:putative cytosolic translation initiation factor 4B [Triangularia setosa]|uniref:Cytosolic translation initiation factor 4B n=1 Tax=Triangularia setosa TaxID=2587417 RepID=A0AAN7A479_9PEZI|nr:putative cytosolic translation initiation factor 4B [Podospora setosa]